ncbi:GFA family protein [Paraburkholderia agricolaris]|uniref:GFA family protein n=1 Tax=Paraburkholderia agricolaris TaxID=2152888 RepID=A0ABW8ZXU4_9BURK|nr:GFA family protein [Paraburkholderia agricolaris]
MTLHGGCYCGEIRYQADGEVRSRLQCHCRECQYISGGNPNVIMAMSTDEFCYLTGQPKQFTRNDIPQPVTREFCGTCGTHLLTRSPRLPGVVLIKVGTLDEPSVFQRADAAIFAIDMQTFHHIQDDVPVFERRKLS